MVPAVQVKAVEAREQAPEKKKEEQEEPMQGTAPITETELPAETTDDVSVLGVP